MKRLIGYILSIAGLALMAISFGAFGIQLEVINSLGSQTVSIVGVALVVVGVFISLKSGGHNRMEEHSEVPIYEGSGKNRRVVGYQRRE